MIFLTEKRLWIEPCLLLLGFFLLTIQSCRNSDSHFIETNKYPSGELLSEIPFLKRDSLKDGTYKEYFRNGKLKKIITFKRGVPADSALQYFESGELEFRELRNSDTIRTYHYFKTGGIALNKKFLNRDPPMEIGWSIFYDEHGGVRDSVQHILLKGATFANQTIKYSGKEIITDSSNYYSFRLKESDIPNKSKLEIRYIPLNKKANVLFVMGENLDRDYGNMTETHLDTLFLVDNQLHVMVSTDAAKTYKGFFYEFEIGDMGIGDSLVPLSEKKTYFYENPFSSSHR